MYNLLINLLLFLSPILAQLPNKATNPFGYIVGNIKQYSFCDGNTEGVVVWAINQCTYGGIAGYPYPNHYAVFTPVYYVNNVGYIDVQLYNDALCTIPSGSPEAITMNQCTPAGNAIYFYFSSTVPNFDGIANGALAQYWYDYSGSTSTQCNDTAIYGTILGANWWGDVCHFDCGSGSSSCSWSEYSTNGAVVSIFSTNYCAASDITSATLIRPSCAMSIETFDDSSDSNSLSKGAVAGITFATTLFGLLGLELLVYFWYRRSQGQAPAHAIYENDSLSTASAPPLQAKLLEPSGSA